MFLLSHIYDIFVRFMPRRSILLNWFKPVNPILMGKYACSLSGVYSKYKTAASGMLA